MKYYGFFTRKQIENNGKKIYTSESDMPIHLDVIEYVKDGLICKTRVGSGKIACDPETQVIPLNPPIPVLLEEDKSVGIGYKAKMIDVADIPEDNIEIMMNLYSSEVSTLLTKNDENCLSYETRKRLSVLVDILNSFYKLNKQEQEHVQLKK